MASSIVTPVQMNPLGRNRKAESSFSSKIEHGATRIRMVSASWPRHFRNKQNLTIIL